MFNVDKFLKEMRLKEFTPSDQLVQQTKQRCAVSGKRLRSRNSNKGKFQKTALIALPAAAILLVGVFLGAFLFAQNNTDSSSAVAFYTVDINPSVCVNVDDTETVVSLKYQNEDAKLLLQDLDLIGLSAPEAIRTIIGAAQQAGYLSSGEKYVLVGRFGLSDKQALNNLQTSLEEELGDMIDLLLVSGTYEDKKEADDLNVSAGLLKLSKLAQGVQLAGGEKVSEVMEDVIEQNKSRYAAPSLSAAPSGSGVQLKWNALDFESMGYTGHMVYKIVVGDSLEAIKSFGGAELHQFEFYSTGTQPQSFFVNPGEFGIPAGEKKYYCIYAIFGGDVMVASNAAAAAAVSTDSAPSETPDPTQTPEPTQAPAPTEPLASEYTVSGSVSGEYVKLTWSKATETNFSGYKVVASKTNPNPKYPEDGYLTYITDRNTTSKSLYEGYSGLKADTFYYFSITYLYDDGTSIAANAVYLKVPAKEEDPSPTTSPGTMTATTIRGEAGETSVNLNWNKIEHDLFSGYKVVASKTNPNPKYPDDGYIAYITNAGTTSYSKSFSYFEAGQTYYFSITVLYSDGTKKAGNAIALTIPEDAEPTEPYVSTDITGVSVGETSVTVNWGEITHPDLEGYKVMYSFNDSTPVYGDSGCGYVWITNSSTISCSIALSTLREMTGYEPGATCYFSITALYESHSVKKPGNVVSAAIS